MTRVLRAVNVVCTPMARSMKQSENAVMSKQYSDNRQDGFTLIELMITLVIAAVLVGIAVPSFQTFIKRNQADTLQSRVASAVATARTEAASRNTFVSMCASDDGAACGGSWNNGWIIYENPDNNTTKNANEIAIEVFDYNGDSTFVMEQGQNTANKLSQITFNQQGFLAGQISSVLVTVCESGRDVKYARGLYINASGLVVKTKDNDGDGVQDYYKSGTATALVCPT